MRMMPMPHVCSQADAIRYLGRVVYDSAVLSGRLKPCCTKPSPTKAMKLYAVADVKAVEDEILSGRFPK